MVRYLATVKLTPQARGNAAKAGFARYGELTAQAWEQVGGKVLSYHVGNAAAEWDSVVIGELPDREAAFALAQASYATGSILNVALQELFTPAEADAAVQGRSIVSPSAALGAS